MFSSRQIYAKIPPSIQWVKEHDYAEPFIPVTQHIFVGGDNISK